MSNNTSQHILNTSANLLGFCLAVMTSLHIADIIESQIIGELTPSFPLHFLLPVFYPSFQSGPPM